MRHYTHNSTELTQHQQFLALKCHTTIRVSPYLRRTLGNGQCIILLPPLFICLPPFNLISHLPTSAVEYRPEKLENDPKALFMQQIPKTFLDLQDAIRKTVAALHQRNAPPIMEEDMFK